MSMKPTAARSLILYQKYNMASSAKLLRQSNEPRIGMDGIRQMRCAGFKSVHKMVSMERFPTQWSDNCLMCNQNVTGGETERHILLYCKRWEVQRQIYLLPLIKRSIKHHQKGKIPGNLSENDTRWEHLLPHKDEEDQVFATLIGGQADIIGVHTDMKISEWFEQVASFLQEIHQRRTATIKIVLEKSNADMDSEEEKEVTE